MSTVTGTFSVVVDGIKTDHTITGMPYPEFWRRQSKVLAVLNMTSGWGLDQILGLPPEFSGAPTGDVGYSYQVDFDGGGTSEGGNVWHGIPADAAPVIGAALNAAFA